MTANGYIVSLEDGSTVLELVVMAAQLYGYTKTTGLYTLKGDFYGT